MNKCLHRDFLTVVKIDPNLRNRMKQHHITNGLMAYRWLLNEMAPRATDAIFWGPEVWPQGPQRGGQWHLEGTWLRAFAAWLRGITCFGESVVLVSDFTVIREKASRTISPFPLPGHQNRRSCAPWQKPGFSQGISFLNLFDLKLLLPWFQLPDIRWRCTSRGGVCQTVRDSCPVKAKYNL